MKALTVRQPHAQLIVMGVKTIETRSWNTAFRGPLVIHAGATPPKTQDIGPWHVWNESGYVWWLDGRKGDPESANYFELPLGAIVGTCNLKDVVPIIDAPPLRPEDFTPEATVICKGITGTLWMVDPNGNPAPIHDQLPYGDFTPGRYAWLLEDIKPTTERCPACWGLSAYHDEYNVDCCATCECQGTCDPVPTKGKQGLWEWTP